MNRFGLSKSLIQAAQDVHAEGNSPDKNVPHVPVKANSTGANLRKREKEISGSHKANVHKEEAVAEALKGGQKKLDKNHNGKLDGQDFKMIRKEETIPFEGPYDKKGPAKDKNVAKNAARKAMKTIKSSMDKVKTAGATVKEAVEQVNEEALGDHAGLAKYADKHGRIDKEDLHTAAKHIKSGNMGALKKHLHAMDTDPRDKALEHVHKKHYAKLGYSNEEVEQVDELTGIKTSPLKKLGYVMKAGKRMTKTAPHDIANDPTTARKFTNTLKTLKKMNKEEVEQVDELSKKTLGSYVNKAVANKGMNDRYSAGKPAGDKESDKVAAQRAAGIKMAVKKLAKEEVQFSPEELERIEAIVGTNK